MTPMDTWSQWFRRNRVVLTRVLSFANRQIVLQICVTVPVLDDWGGGLRANFQQGVRSRLLWQIG